MRLPYCYHNDVLTRCLLQLNRKLPRLPNSLKLHILFGNVGILRIEIHFRKIENKNTY